MIINWYGVDIGQRGGFCKFSIENKELSVELFNISEINNINKDKLSFIETVFHTPISSRMSLISFGQERQKVLSVVENNYIEIHPKSWQKYYYNKVDKSLNKRKKLEDNFNYIINLGKIKKIGRETEGTMASFLIGFYAPYFVVKDYVFNDSIKKTLSNLNNIRKNLKVLVYVYKFIKKII